MQKKDVKVVKETKKERKEEVIKTYKANSLFTGILIFIAVIIVAAVTLKPIFKNLNYGLDLKGGFEILYEVKDINGKEPSKDMVKNTYRIIENRINILGVSEPEISIEGNNIRVQLAGVTDEEEAKSTISKMANLTFRNENNELVMTADVLEGNGVVAKQDESNLSRWYLAIKIADVDTFHEKTEEIRKNNGKLAIWLDFDETTDTYETKCNKDIVTNCLSGATISEELTTTDIRLTGNFTKEEANRLADLINSGSLPAKLNELSSQTVDATFGEDTLDKTFVAALIGVIVIMLVLIFVYNFSGIITSLSVLLYTMLVFVIFELIGGRLTLPGIAAVVIGIGMAVDAASISFSSIKKELKNGRTVKEAYKNGNKTSFKAIIDSNLTTLIAAIVLYIFGVSSVKGFATMLIISIFVTVMIMVFFNRYLLGKFVESGIFDKHERLFIGVSKKPHEFHVKFVKARFATLVIIPLILIVAGGISLWKQGLNLGVDFKGGTTIQIASSEKLTEKDLKADIESLGYKVTNTTQLNDKSIIVNSSNIFKSDDNKAVEEYLTSKYDKDGDAEKSYVSTNISAISNTVKKELIKNALKALFYACICIVLYISIRFRFSNAVSTIAALIHDCLIVFIAFSLLRFEVTSVFVAAILSIIGYSINDTIVIFDKIRDSIESLGKKEIKTKEELADIIDQSLNDVLGRCIITSITTLIPVVSLIIFGSHDIVNFNMALLFGLAAGTFSSLFIAAELWYTLEKRNIGKPKKKKWYEDDSDKKEVRELKVKGINC